MRLCEHFEQGDAKGTIATVARNKLRGMKLGPGGNSSLHMANAFEQFPRLKKAGEGWTDNHKREHLLLGLRGTDHASMVNVLEDPKMSLADVVSRLRAKELRISSNRGSGTSRHPRRRKANQAKQTTTEAPKKTTAAQKEKTERSNKQKKGKKKSTE